jgi:hypothetical protein
MTSKFSDYTSPPPKGPYQLNDIAVVNKFVPSGVQTKASAINIGKIGIVIGYKNVPGSYSKYLLKFNDGNIDGYMPKHLSGPFISKQIAQTYADDPNKPIEPSDIKTKSGAILSNEWETLPRVEAKLKDFLVNTMHFTWFDQPVPTTEFGSDPSFKIAELQGFPRLCLFRTHNRTTRKLKGTSYWSSSARGYTLYLPDPTDIYAGGNLTSDRSSVPLDEITGKRDRKSFLAPEYMHAYDRLIRMKQTVDRIPELEGIL